MNVLDELHLIDDQSIDNTVEILAGLAEEGLPIKRYSLLDKNAQIKNLQSEVLTNLMHRVASLDEGADSYVFPLDADEIILCKREDLIARLASMPKHLYGLMKWKTFAPIGGKTNHKDSSLHERFRPLIKEQKAFYKVIVPQWLAQQSIITMGNHSLISKATGTSSFDLEIDLGHFPVRTANQLITKCLVAAHKTHLKKAAHSGENYHIIFLAEKIRQLNYEIAENQLNEFALNYLQSEPTGIDFNSDLLSILSKTTSKFNPRVASPLAVLDALLADVAGFI